MPRMTKREMVCRMLERLGHERVEYRYGGTVYLKSLEPKMYYFVGKSGGLRVGPSKGKSRSLTQFIPQMVKRSFNQ